jgi:transcriptional regulator
MYRPPQFSCTDPALVEQLLREHPFASLISLDSQGAPFVSHLPLHLTVPTSPDNPNWTLLGHVAKGNPHARHLQDSPGALVTFMGPQAYMSPSVYPDLARVPTWNYLAVHCEVQVSLITDAQEKDALLKQLIADHEPAYAQQWRGLDEEFAQKMLSGIVGLRMQVVSWKAKFKLNQHRTEARQAMHDQYAAGTPNEQALSVWMQRLGLV